MFKRLTSFVLLLTVFNTYAIESSGTTLKDAFDSLNYSLSVEWDQQDKEFRTAKIKDFNAKVRDLQKKGLTNAELVDFAKSQINDENTKKTIDNVMTSININQLSSKEARKLILDEVKNSYQQGANWTGSGSVVLTAVVVLLVISAGLAAGNNNRGFNGGICYDDYVCYDYFDPYWGWYTDCFYETYCY